MKVRWLIAAMVALWGLDALLGMGAYWSHDLRHHHIPWRVWASGEWAAFRVPSWNPDVGNGFPLTADGQTGSFYVPSMVLFAVLPVVWAVNASVLGHLALAAAGMHRLMGALGVKGRGALLAAAAFAFSGFMSSHTGYLGMQNAAAWLPWLACAVIRGRWAWVAFSATMLAVAGHPQIALIGWVLATAIAWWAGTFRTFLLGMIVAVVASSPQWLATFELVGTSMRSGGVSEDFARMGVLPMAELINGVLPEFFGKDRPADIAQTYFHRGEGYWGQGANHWDMSFYLGIPVVILAALGCRAQRFWVGVSGVAILVMVGSPLWDALRVLPGLDAMRYPVRFSLWLTLAVAVLAGFGLERAVNHRNPIRVSQWLVGLAGGFAGLLTIGGVVFERMRPALEERLMGRYLARVNAESATGALQGMPDASAGYATQRTDQILQGMEASLSALHGPNLIAIALLLLVAGLFWLRARGTIEARAMGLMLVGLAYADLWGFGANYNPRTPAADVNRVPVAVDRLGPSLQQGRMAVVDRRRDPSLDREILTSNMGLQYGLSDVLVPSPLMNPRNEEVLETVGIDVGDRGPEKWDRVSANRPVLDFLGVRWLFSEHAPPSEGFTPHLTDPVFVVENPSAMPRDTLVWCVEIAEDSLTALQSVDPAVFAVVEEDVGISECRVPMSDGSVDSVAESPTMRSLVVRSAAPALLVSAETHAPGWVALVDGTPTPIHRVNHAFRGVVVGSGEHTVEFRYEPMWLTTALPISSLAWVFMGVGLYRRELEPSGEE